MEIKGGEGDNSVNSKMKRRFKKNFYNLPYFLFSRC
jgi:hypothetical protein